MNWNRKWKLSAAAIAVACLVISYFINERWHFGSETLQHGAAAILIAILVATSVERGSQQRIDVMESESRLRHDQAEARHRDRIQAIERLAHERLDRERELHEEYAKQATEASFTAVGRVVFGAFHSTEVLQEAIQSIFTETLLRRDYVQEIVFQRVPGCSRAVKITQMTKYVVVNPSKVTTAVFRPKFAADDTSPLYVNEPEKYSPVMTSLIVGDRVYTREDIEKFETVKERQVDNQELDYVLKMLGTYEIPPQGELPVNLRFEHVEALDGEWPNRCFLPTKGLTVKVRNEFGPDFAVFLGALFRGNFGRVRYLNPDKTEWERSYDGVILPNSGWTLRWNNVAHPRTESGIDVDRPDQVQPG